MPAPPPAMLASPPRRISPAASIPFTRDHPPLTPGLVAWRGGDRGPGPPV